VGDEATGFITVFSFGASVLTILVRKYLYVTAAIETWCFSFAARREKRKLLMTRIFLSIASLFCGFFVYGRAVHLHAKDTLVKSLFDIVAVALSLPLLWLFAELISFYAFLAPTAGIVLFAPFAIAIMAVAVLPMGPGCFAMTLFYEATVEAVPAGEWWCTRLFLNSLKV
jgi:hypothetical protein